jgi:hypothetical protein
VSSRRRERSMVRLWGVEIDPSNVSDLGGELWNIGYGEALNHMRFQAKGSPHPPHRRGRHAGYGCHGVG